MATEKEKTAPKAVSAKQHPWRMHVALAIIAGILLIVANSALWFNDNIFDTTTFTNTASQALLSESSRDALAGTVVNKALAGQPALQSLVAQPATNLISGLLNSDLAHTAVQRTVTKLQTTITSKNPQPIAINLVPLKTTLTKVMTLASAISGGQVGSGANFDPSTLPDAIVLLNTNSLPNIYVMGTVLLWLGPLAAVVGLGLLIFSLYRTRRDLHLMQLVLALQGVVMLFAWGLALLFGPLFRPPVLAQVNDPNLRIVVENVYDAFFATFDSQVRTLLVLGVLLLIASGALWYYLHRPFLSRSKAA